MSKLFKKIVVQFTTENTATFLSLTNVLRCHRMNCYVNKISTKFLQIRMTEFSTNSTKRNMLCNVSR